MAELAGLIPSQPRRDRGRVVGALVGLVALLATAACGPASANAQWQNPGGQGPLGAELTFSHQDGATDVSPGQPVSVQVVDGVLDDVELTSPAGAITGEFTNDNLLWRSTQDLDYGKTYTMSVHGTGKDGKAIARSRTFTTVNVRDGYYWNVYFRANDYGFNLNGGTFGVGQPIVAWFDDAVDKATAEKSLTVTTTPAVEGSWYWVSNTEAHWRPQNYWAPGTKVTVEAKVLGVTMKTTDGRELHGQENKSATFTIGPSKIAKIDNNTHQMKIYVDGVEVRTIAVSLGRDGGYTDPFTHEWFDLRTTSGPHIVLEKSNPVRMRPADVPKEDTVNYYDLDVANAVRISDSGIYVHDAYWSVGDQGYRNVSHGCVNVSSANAAWFFSQFNPGDVVEITNTGKQLGLTDGLGDWTLTWDQWKAGSAPNR